MAPLLNGYEEHVGVKTDIVTANPSILATRWGNNLNCITLSYSFSNIVTHNCLILQIWLTFRTSTQVCGESGPIWQCQTVASCILLFCKHSIVFPGFLHHWGLWVAHPVCHYKPKVPGESGSVLGLSRIEEKMSQLGFYDGQSSAGAVWQRGSVWILALQSPPRKLPKPDSPLLWWHES